MTDVPQYPSQNTIDEPVYDWLEEQIQQLSTLTPDGDTHAYVSALQKMIAEGSEKLQADKEDPVLECHLQQLLAEARLDMALVEKADDTRQALLEASYQGCARVISTLQSQKMCGLSCTFLPRTIAILGYVFYNIAPEKESLLTAAQKEAMDLLESSLAQQQLDREKAVDLISTGRFLAGSISDISNLSDRRVMLENALDNFRQAAYLSGRAFDFNLAGQAQEIQATLEVALSSPDLSILSLPLPTVETSNPLEPVDRYLAALASSAPVSSPAVEAVCRKCGSPLKPGKKFCGVCGAPIKQSSTAIPENHTCPKCGNGLKPGVKFCSHCGNKL
jgi:hypothetical protein